MSGGIKKCVGCDFCKKRLRLSWKVDECKPLPVVAAAAAVSFPAWMRRPPGPQLGRNEAPKNECASVSISVWRGRAGNSMRREAPTMEAATA